MYRRWLLLVVNSFSYSHFSASLREGWSLKDNSEFQKLQRLQQLWQYYKSMISLVEWQKLIILHMQHELFEANFSCGLPNNKVKFSFLRFWQQCKPSAINLPFSAFAWKPCAPRQWWVHQCPKLYNVTNMELQNTYTKFYFNVTFSSQQIIIAS